MPRQKKINIKGKHIAIGFLVLILIIGITAWINLSQQDEGIDGYTLTIAGNGEEIRSFTLDQIRELPSEEADVELQSAKEADEKGSFKGIDLVTLLDRTDPTLLKEYDQFIFVAGDGYSSALTAKEIQKGGVLLAYEKDGQDLEHFNAGGGGPMRLIVTTDTYGNRSTKYLVRIECRK